MHVSAHDFRRAGILGPRRPDEIDGESAYIGTPLGVAEFRDGRFTRELAPGTLSQTLLVRDRQLLIGTLDEGVIEIPLDVRPPRGPRPVSGSTPGGAGNAVRRLIALEGEVYALAGDGVYQRAALAGGWRPVLQPAGAVLTDRNIAALSVESGREGKNTGRPSCAARCSKRCRNS